MKSIFALIFLSSIFCIQVQADDSNCDAVISENEGFEVSTKEKNVFMSIEKTKDAKKTYWLQKALTQPLITYKTRWSSDIYDGENLVIMDPVDCSVLDSLVVWSD